MTGNGQDPPPYQLRIEASGTVGQGTGPPVPADQAEDNDEQEQQQP